MAEDREPLIGLPEFEKLTRMQDRFRADPVQARELLDQLRSQMLSLPDELAAGTISQQDAMARTVTSVVMLVEVVDAIRRMPRPTNVERPSGTTTSLLERA